MKKKLLSVFLAFCMICSFLPATALAATPADNEIKLELVKDSITFSGKDVLRVDFMYKSGTDTPNNQMIYLKFNADKLAPLYNVDGSDVSSNLTSFSINYGDSLTKNNYVTTGFGGGASEVMLYALVSGSNGYMCWKVTEKGNPPAFADFTRISSIFFGLKDVTFDKLPKDIIKLATPAEDGGVTAQSNSISLTVNGGGTDGALMYGSETAANNLNVDLDKLFVAGEGVTFAEPAKPELKGSVTIDNTTPKFGDKLTADTTGLNYNGAATGGTLTYQWYRGTEKIIGADKATYTTVAADMNHPIKVEVMNSNNSSSVFSMETNKVAKAAGPAAPAGLAEVSKTDTTITVTSNAAWEYSIDGGGKWQDSNVFTGLTANTTYDKIVARVKTTDTHEASAACAAISVTTAKGSADSGLQTTLKNSHTPYTGTYDGKAHNAFTADMSSMTGWTATYSSTETGTYSSTMPAVTNVTDSGKIYVKFSHNDYADVCIDYIVTVNKADYTFTPTGTATASVGTAKPTSAPATATGVNSETVSGMLTWYTDAECKTPASGNFEAAGTVDLWWKFVPEDTATNYDTTPKTDKVTYTVSNLPAQTVSFADAGPITKNFGDGNFTNAATSSDGGTITYSGDNDAVATVTPNTGVVTIHGVGTVHITATAAATSTHSAGQASYTLTVSPQTIAPTVTVNGTYTYNGDPITPTYMVEITSGTALPTDQYEAELTNNTDAGTAHLKIKAKAGGNYSFTAVDQPFTIDKKKAPELTAKAPDQFTLLGVGDFVEPIVYGVKGEVLEGTITYDLGTDHYPNKAAVVAKLQTMAAGASLPSLQYVFDPTSDNYLGSKVGNFTITVKDKVDVSGKISFADGTLTYNGNGQTYEKATISGITASGTAKWSYTYAAADATATLDGGKPKTAGTYTVTAVYEDDNNYGTTSAKLTINRADPTGKPTYTAITTSGKKLSDAALDIGSITPTGGSIAWDLGDTTEVTANTAYNWTYTLADTNYDKLTGTITPYVVSYSGGGSYTPTYAITVDKTANGTVTAAPGTAKKGDTVTLTATPDKGYELDTIKALDKDGKEIKLTDQGNGKYTFTMPAGKVTVKAAFEDSNLVKFDDVSKGDYCYEAVKWAVKNGITSGIGNNRFGPNDPCTRGQIVTFLWRAAGSPEPKSMSSFTDVPADSYYAKAVAWAVEKGITSGTGDGNFSPEDPCTRAQSVTFLYRAAGSPAVIGSAEFSDVESDTYYAAAVTWAAKNGITSGTGGGQFGSDDECSRGHIVTFLFNAYGK